MRSFLLAFCLLAVTRTFAQVPLLNSYHVSDTIPVLYLDFDGYEVDSSNRWFWNMTEAQRHCAPSGLNADQILTAFNIVAEDYRPFVLNVTTNEAVYNAAPFDRRVRVVITKTSWWNDWNGGVAFIGSYDYADDTPCWAFSQNLQMNAKYIGDVCTHESGHTFGLDHHGVYDTATCNLVDSYEYGNAPYDDISWAPIMGASYYTALGTWDIGGPSNCSDALKDDLKLLGYHLRRRDDDHPYDQPATMLVDSTNTFNAQGIIEQKDDSDLFVFNLPSEQRLTLEIAPVFFHNKTRGMGNLDLRAALWTENGQRVDFAPPENLSVKFDTILPAGKYFLQVANDSNRNFSNYGSLGTYVVSGKPTREPTRNLTPHAIAGDDQTVFIPKGQTTYPSLELNASGNDSDGEIESYAWRQITGTRVLLTITSATGAIAQSLLPGNYAFELTVTDDSSAVGRDTVTIHVLKTPQVSVRLNVSDTTICEGTSITLQTNNIANAKYSWSTGEKSPSIIVSKAGTYAVTVDSAGYSAIASVVIKTQQAFTSEWDYAISNSCDSTVVNFFEKTTLNCGALVQRTWDFGDGTTLDNLNGGDVKHVYKKGNANYTIVLYLRHETGQEIRSSKQIKIASYPYPSFSLPNDTTICSGDSVLVTINTNEPVDFTWPVMGDEYLADPAAGKTIVASKAGMYIAIAESTNGCRLKDTFNLTMNPALNPHFSVLSGLLPGIKIFRNETTSCADNSSLRYHWNFGDSTQSDEESPIHDFRKSGNYTVRLSVLNDRFQTAYAQEVLTINLDTNEIQLMNTVVHSVVNVTAVKPFNYSLISMQGAVLRSGTVVVGQNRIPADGISSGLFLIRFTNQQTRKVFKLLKLP